MTSVPMSQSLDRPLMLLLTGISFAGKSVLSKALSQSLALPVIDPDKVGHEMGLGLQGEFLSDQQWQVIHAEAERRASELLAGGQSIVYDTTSFTAGQRAQLIDLAKASGAEALIVFVDTPRELAYARWSENNRSQARFLVHEDDFNSVADAFERPGEGENYIVFTPDQDPAEWIRTHFSKRSNGAVTAPVSRQNRSDDQYRKEFDGINITHTLCFCRSGDFVLLLYRSYEPNRHLWNGLGGKIEPGESPLQGVIREVFEESGIDLNAAPALNYAGVVTWDSVESIGFSTGGMHVFLADLLDEEFWDASRATEEGELRWHPLAWVLDQSNPAVVSNIPQFLPRMLASSIPKRYSCTYDGNVLKHLAIKDL